MSLPNLKEDPADWTQEQLDALLRQMHERLPQEHSRLVVLLHSYKQRKEQIRELVHSAVSKLAA